MTDETKGCPICGRQPQVKRDHFPDWDCEFVCAPQNDDGTLDHLVTTTAIARNGDFDEAYEIAKAAWNTRPAVDGGDPRGCPICGAAPKVERSNDGVYGVLELGVDCEIVCSLWSKDGKLDHLCAAYGKSPSRGFGDDIAYETARSIWNRRTS